MCIEQANMAGSDVMMAVEMLDVGPGCGDGSDLSACTSGTVGQLEACFNDTLDMFRARLDDWSCDDAPTLTTDDLETLGDETEPPASCASIECGDNGPFGME
jgi:hypothetical protein